MPDKGQVLLNNEIGRDVGERFSGTLGGLISGNFDGDADQELLLVGMKQSHIYNADGSAVPVKLHGAGFFMNLSSWDCDGDGIDEIVPEAIQYSVAVNFAAGKKNSSVPTTTPVFRLDGTQIGTLKGIQTLTTAQGDVDGDGFRELGFPGIMQFTLFGRLGSPMPNFTNLPLRAITVTLADPFGAGHSGLVIGQNHGRELSWLDASGTQRPMGQITFAPIKGQAADIDGDARDEIIFGGEGFWNATAGFVPFGYRNSKLPDGCTTTVGDIMAQGTKQVIVLEGPSIPCDDLAIFDTLGNLVHREHCPEGIHEIMSLSSNGKDYLCLQLSDKLLIYP